MLGLRLLPLAACCAALTATPATAFADTTAKVEPWGQLVVESTAAGEHNDLSVLRTGASVVVREHGAAAVTPLAGCSTTGEREVTCSAPDVQKSIIVQAGPGDDTVRPDDAVSPRKLVGGDGDDTLAGSAGIDVLEGGAGADTLDGGLGSDSFVGGEHPGAVTGADTVVFAVGRDAQAGVTVTLPAAGSTAAQSNFTRPGEVEQLREVENVFGGPGDDNLTGNEATNHLRGGAGRDHLKGMGEADLLQGQDGDDAFLASPNDGDDTYEGGAEDWSVRGDYVFYGARSTALEVRLPDAGGDETTGNGAANEDDGLHGIESVWGGKGADRLVAGTGPNELLGGAGDDTIAGGEGDDELSGDEGADDLDAGAGDDVVRARDGRADAAIACGDGADRLTADNALEAVTRPAGCDLLAPQIGANAHLPSTPHVGDVLTVRDLGLTGDAATLETAWWSCTTVELDDCEERPAGASLTLGAADLGRVVYAELRAANAVGQDVRTTEPTQAITARPPVVEQQPPAGLPADDRPDQKPADPQPQPQPQPQPRQDPAPAAAPAPVTTADVTAPAPRPATNPFLAVARRLLGARAVGAGSVGAVRMFTAPGKGVALVCTKGRCRVAVGKRRFTIAAGKGRRVRARKGAKVRVAVLGGRKAVRRTLRAR